MNVILPEVAAEADTVAISAERPQFPLLFLLHGWSDDESIWVRRTSIERYAARHGLAVVMPRVELSFYQNTHSGMRYWDFLANELPRRVRDWFPVARDSENTFAAGLSMGGYGALRLGLACPERFAAVASLSGAVDVRECAGGALSDGREAKFEAIFGPAPQAPGDDADLFALARELATLKTPAPRIYLCCGTDDFLLSMNRRFRDHLAAAGLPADYREGPGDHDWDYWDRQIEEVLAWMLPGPAST